MPLAPGTRLGPYEIVAPLGAGGMGEVFRAKDTRLGREIAIKVLPGHLSSNPEVRARFEREAKTVSSLNHPNICTLHDVGREGNVDYLVMEMIEGETLAQRLTRGALPLPDVLKIGSQIADALGRAHKAGVMHRDLKPGNIMLTRSGAKLMDFGLARATGLGATSDLTSSPTVAEPLTAQGTLLGTFQYMAPEQLEGREADARADLWALGCVLYEMATGKRAFDGATQASLISAIMRDAPRPMAELAPMSPPALERVVRHCLAKDPEDRIQTAHDVKLQLEGIAEPASSIGAQTSGITTTPAAPAASEPNNRERIAWALFALALAAAGIAWWKGSRPVAVAEAQPMRFVVTAPPHGRLAAMSDDVSISPDGKTLVFVASDAGGIEMLWVRDLDAVAARSLEGTENPRFPFWSPDGRTIGFFAQGKLKKVAVTGGFPEVMADASDARGGTWGASGDILYTPRPTGGIWRIPASGGQAAEVLSPDASRKETNLRFPQFLGDTDRFVFVSLPAPPSGGFEIHLGSLATKTREPLMRADSTPAWAAPGFLVGTRNRRLVAWKFDLETHKLIGEPRELGIAPSFLGPDGVPVAAASRNGILVSSASRVADTQAAWYDRTGKRQSVVPLPKGFWLNADVAPDGRRILIGKPDSAVSGDWWIAGADGAGARRFVTAIVAGTAAWSPDGSRLVYQVNKNGPSDVYVKSIDAESEEPILVSDVLFKNPYQWTPDGKFVTVNQPDPKTGWDIWRVPLDGDHKPEPIVNTTANEFGGWVSPDNRWITYTSDESGRDELYVRSYPAGGKRLQLTTTGVSTFPLVHWSPDGREIILYDGTIRSIAIDTKDGALRADAPSPLFTPPQGHSGYAVTTNHDRFLILEPVTEPLPASIEVDVNWAASLPR